MVGSALNVEYKSVVVCVPPGGSINAQKKEKLDVRARPYKEGRPRWVGFIQDGSYLVGKAMTAHGMPKPSPTESAGAVEGTERAREGCFVPELKGWVCQAPSVIL